VGFEHQKIHVIERPLRKLAAFFMMEPLWPYSYTREKDVSSIFGDMVSFRYIWCCFVSTPCEDPPFLYISYDSLDLCKPSENKSSKISYIYHRQQGTKYPRITVCMLRLSYFLSRLVEDSLCSIFKSTISAHLSHSTLSHSDNSNLTWISSRLVECFYSSRSSFAPRNFEDVKVDIPWNRFS